MINPELLELGFEKNNFPNLKEGAQAVSKGIIKWEEKNTHEKLLVLISGPSASGKDTFIEELHSDPIKTTFLSLDRYYRGIEAGGGEVKPNFSTPEALDNERILDDVKKLLESELGSEVSVPIYSMKQSKRVGEENIIARERIIIEGVFAIATVDAKTPFKIYLDTDPEIMLKRKLVRDVRDRGVSEEVVRERFIANVMPATEEYVLPQKMNASIIIESNDQELAEYK